MVQSKVRKRNADHSGFGGSSNFGGSSGFEGSSGFGSAAGGFDGFSNLGGSSSASSIYVESDFLSHQLRKYENNNPIRDWILFLCGQIQRNTMIYK